MSGSSTPLSSSTTLTDSSGSNSPTSKSRKLAEEISSGSVIIQSIASSNSSTVFVYDTALDVGFGYAPHQVPVVHLQNRAGAGLLIAGRLSTDSESSTRPSGVLSAYVASHGLAQMVPSLALLPQPTNQARLVIQVPAVSPLDHSLALVPSLGVLSSSLVALNTTDDIAVLVSATPNEAIDLTNVSYAIPNKHVIHLFDQYGSAREARKLAYPPNIAQSQSAEKALEQAGYTPFDYTGDAKATVVLVVFNGAFGAMVKQVVKKMQGVGVVTVRLVRPWNEEAFKAIVPPSTSKFHVLSEANEGSYGGALYEDVWSTYVGTKAPIIREHLVTPEQLHNFLSSPSELVKLVHSAVDQPIPPTITLGSPNLKKLLFLSTPSASPSTSLSTVIANSFLSHNTIHTRLLTTHDAFSKAGGISASRLLLQPSTDVDAADDAPVDLFLPLKTDGSDGTADFIAVLDQSLIKTHDVLDLARPKASVLILTTWSTSPDANELVANLPNSTVQLAKTKSLSLYSLNTKSIASELLPSGVPSAKELLETVLAHLAFLRLYVGIGCTLPKLIRIAEALYGGLDLDKGLDMEGVVTKLWENLLQVDLPAPSIEETEGGKLKAFEFNSVDLSFVQGVGANTQDSSTMPVLGTWHDAAKHLLFREAFSPTSSLSSSEDQQNPALRPDISDRTYLVECSVNRRLTPNTYDRNVFHLEFSTKGTGLTYAIGEALGIHGWNDTDDVLDFCKRYGVDPDALVTIPVPESERNSASGKLMHTRTVFQALQQQIDIFGRPPKSFYSLLASHAALKSDRLALHFIGAAEGASTFKKLSEVDTVTFADVLLDLFPSARPKEFGVLCELVGDIKPRHYSIASAQSAVGDRVDLLVVTVDWVTPSGSPRFGQCTRYLAGLQPGQKVTVSIKPSVMKLPPDNMQPIIMAGLGTGAAPFRAFIQHRAHLASQNIPVGPLIYYFGSRHRSEEYLYGEELEAYVADSIITHIGLAFSRDQKKKVYIQHKMMEDGKMLSGALLAGHNRAEAENDGSKGVFYLCGPTWPVPDVYEALLDALERYGGMGREEGAAYLEGLKEEERYVLEVY